MSGSGSGSVTVTATGNNDGSTRNCSATIAEQSFQVTQALCGPPPECFVTRYLPPWYMPSVSLIVTNCAVPSAGIAVYAVEDLPPVGWVLGAISDGGSLDANGKVKWGPFFDNIARCLTYQITPPAGITNRVCFTGTGSTDGLNCTIKGSNCLDGIICAPHPADGSGCIGADWYVRIGEVTAYGAAWKNGTSWSCPPNPIPISYMTRAGYIWKNGEHYCCDPSLSAPLSWNICPTISGLAAPPPAGASTVTSSITDCTVCLTAIPDASVGVYAVEDTVPVGCTVSAITSGGTFDAVNRKVKWGPWFDNTPRTVCYTLGTGCPGALSGVGSFDGVDETITGQRQPSSCANPPALLSIDLYAGVMLAGTVGQTFRVEWSQVADGGTWTPVATLILTNATQLFVDASSPCRSNRFYRAVLVP